MQASLTGRVGIFFLAGDELLLHTCPLAEAQPYGDFLNYPRSHDCVWEQCYRAKYGVDFDYHPRGRILYNAAEKRYILYHDGCAAEAAEALARRFDGAEVSLERDGHYQCHLCNPDYAFIER